MMPGRGMPDLNFQPAVPSEALEAPNPDCQDAMCNSTFWVPENKLCIYCGHRG